MVLTVIVELNHPDSGVIRIRQQPLVALERRWRLVARGEVIPPMKAGSLRTCAVERNAYLVLFDTSKLLCSCLGHGSLHAYACVVPLLVRRVSPLFLRLHSLRRQPAQVL